MCWCGDCDVCDLLLEDGASDGDAEGLAETSEEGEHGYACCHVLAIGRSLQLELESRE